MIYVRSLFGRPHKKFLAEVRRSLTLMGDPYQQWAKKRIRYFTTGNRNTELLKDLGARHVTQLSAKPFGLARRDGWLNHWRIIQHAVEQYGEILHTDFDCWPTSLFNEERAVQILRRHYGIGRWLQAPMVRYRNPVFFTRGGALGKGWEGSSNRVALNVSFFYIASRPVMQSIVEDHVELARTSRRSLTTEHSLIYCLEKRLGRLTHRDLYMQFEPEIVYLRRSPLWRLGVEKREVMFWHA
jgi:hypothetical protein